MRHTELQINFKDCEAQIRGCEVLINFLRCVCVCEVDQKVRSIIVKQFTVKQSRHISFYATGKDGYKL